MTREEALKYIARRVMDRDWSCDIRGKNPPSLCVVFYIDSKEFGDDLRNAIGYGACFQSGRGKNDRWRLAFTGYPDDSANRLIPEITDILYKWNTIFSRSTADQLIEAWMANRRSNGLEE